MSSEKKTKTEDHRHTSDVLIELYTEGDGAEQIVADLKKTGWIHYIKPTPSSVAHHITQFLMHDADIISSINHENMQQITTMLTEHPLVHKIATLLKAHQRY